MSIEFKNAIAPSPEQWMCAILGARNAMNSWGRSDTIICGVSKCNDCKLWNIKSDALEGTCLEENGFYIGQNDHDLLMRLCMAGESHRKFMRMLPVYVTITAPLYWFKEFDTYKVGVTTNSCSTMHKIHAKEFTLEDFSCEHLDLDNFILLKEVIARLNRYRDIYINGGIVEYPDGGRKVFKPKDKDIWWQMIQLLPSSYNQKRTIMLNYEVLANMYKSRKNHKLDEWVEFCKWIETLPYAELITGEFDV